MLLKIILWYLKKIGAEYTIGTKDHIYINYPNAVFGDCNPNSVLYVDGPGIVAKDTKMEVECPKHKLDLSQFKSPRI